MRIDISYDKIAHLFALIVSSSIIAYAINYWFGGSMLMNFSGGVTIALQINNLMSSNNVEHDNADDYNIEETKSVQKPSQATKRKIKK